MYKGIELQTFSIFTNLSQLILYYHRQIARNCQLDPVQLKTDRRLTPYSHTKITLKTAAD